VGKPQVGGRRSFNVPAVIKIGFGLTLALVMLGVVAPTAAQAATPTVYQWGFGSGSTAPHHLVPTSVQGLPSGIVAVQAGNWGGMALDSHGNVWDWGSNTQGELGNARQTGSSWSTAVEAQGPSNIVSIGEGNSFAAAVDAHGDLWVWGNNNFGQLCFRSRKNSVPRPVELSGVHAAAVSGGGFHLEVLLTNGTVDACGINEYGQLGNGSISTERKLTPVMNLTHVVAVSSGDLFSSALTSDGSVWEWGYNRYGQLGNGNTTNEDVPQEVTLPSKATQIFAGGDFPNNGHMVVLLSTGVAETWGNNAWGQLGIGMRGGIKTTPVAVKMPTGVTFTVVAAGGEETYGIDAAGNLWGWGGSKGELGNGNGRTARVTSPMKIAKGFSAVSATASVSVGLSTGP
jgi:alpha-tubulin suppressor-like RCC1 family protein